MDTRLYCLLVLIVLGATTAVVPLAHSSPPDPAWVEGCYDHADHDDAVLAAAWGVASMRAGAAMSGAEAAETVAHLAPAVTQTASAEALGFERTKVPRSPAFPFRATRSPPAA